MFTVLSPAKKLDFGVELPWKATTPELIKETAQLSQVTRALGPSEVSQLMKLSPALAQLNYQRFQDFEVDSRASGARPAAAVFDGDTYVGLRAREFSKDELAFAQDHLGILSGMYGILRPRDAIQPYRLEMGTRLANPRGKNLYEFWGEGVAHKVNRRLEKLGSQVLINLASKEYFAVLAGGALRATVITPVFKEMRGGKPKIISFSAKRARGAMARYIVEQRLTEPAGLKKYKRDGYKFERSLSSESEWVFLRPGK